MRPLLAFAAAIAALAAGPAAAQIGNPAGMKPDTPKSEPGTPAPGHPNTQDRLFVQLLGMGSTAEVEAGKLAEGRAGSEAVRTFARRMVQDHGQASAQLADVARKTGIAWPADVAPEHKLMRQHLEALRGAEFDRAYLQGQLVEHQKAAQLLEWEIGLGQESELVRFASSNLPVVLEHLERLQALWAEATGASPSGLAAALSSPGTPRNSGR